MHCTIFVRCATFKSDDNTDTIKLNMKILIMLLTTLMLLSSCTSTDESTNQEHQSTDSLPSVYRANMDTIPELTPEQQSAFDALNTLQVSTDKMNRLYSTFAGITQPCYPPDTSLTISQSELLIAMKQFVTSNCKNLSAEKRDELATTSVLAQDEYTVSLCLDNSVPVTYENGAPMTGTWVVPSVLGQRDVIIVW